MNAVPARRWWALLGTVAVLILWEANAWLRLYRAVAPNLSPAFFPPLAAVLKASASRLATDHYCRALLLTVGRTLVAFLSSGVVGVVGAALATRSRVFDSLTHYLFEFLRHVPAVAIIPLAVILFGVYSEMKVAVAFFGCVFPVFVGTREGLRHIDPVLLATAEAYGWRGWRLALGVMFPAALPSIVGSLRVSLAIALILVVTAEMLVGGDGLGGSLVEMERAFRLTDMYAETMLMGFVGVVVNGLFAAAMRRACFWTSEP